MSHPEPASDAPPPAGPRGGTLQEQNLLSRMADRLEGRPPQETLQWAVARYAPKIVMATGFGPQSIIQLHMLAESYLLDRVTVFYLDTGFLFDETHETRERLEVRFGFRAEAVRPTLSPAEQAERLGPELWSTDPTRCCGVRKVEPLRSRLAGEEAWITGLRRSSSATRAAVPLVMWDEANGMAKINPLATFGESEVWSYILEHGLPYNPLRDRGYRSIGCTHCTSPVTGDGDERDGRWQGKGKTECGIHLDGKVIRDEASEDAAASRTD